MLFNKNKLKPHWVFSQTGNLWRFILAGDNIIVGESRDIDNKKVYFFSLNYDTGKINFKDFLFEEGNYWISIEGSSNNLLFLHRYEKPELPYHRSVIAVDIFTGEKIWENEKYTYLFNTNETVFASKLNFESSDIVELNIGDGTVKKYHLKEDHINIFKLRDSVEEFQFQNTFYPSIFSFENTTDYTKNIIQSEISNTENKGDIEFILKNNFLIFNYYVNSGINIKDLNSRQYENRLRIFDINTGKKIYEDLMNKKSTYSVPDNFFIKNNFLFYLKEKKELLCIKL